MAKMSYKYFPIEFSSYKEYIDYLIKKGFAVSVTKENNPYKKNRIMKLWKVHIKTYYFGVHYYDLFVLADTENNMLKTVYRYPAYHKDEDAEIMEFEEIDLNNSANIVL